MSETSGLIEWLKDYIPELQDRLGVDDANQLRAILDVLRAKDADLVADERLKYYRRGERDALDRIFRTLKHMVPDEAAKKRADFK